MTYFSILTIGILAISADELLLLEVRFFKLEIYTTTEENIGTKITIN